MSAGIETSGRSFLAGLITLSAVLVLSLTIGVSAAPAKRASVPSGFFGMVNQEASSPADISQMERGGVEFLRLPVPWDQIQTTKTGDYNWSYTDSQVRNAAEGGLKVLPFIYASPSWLTSKYTKLPIANSNQITAWKTFLKAAVNRYGPGGDFWTTEDGNTPPTVTTPIRVWQIWNEVNFHYFAEPVSPTNYAKLLRISKSALKSEDPSAKIMLSGLYGSPKGSAKRAMSADKFLARLYAAGAAPNFDSVALHPYSPTTSQLRLLVKGFRNVMMRNGGRSTPMNITELGWGSDSATAFGKGSPSGQAKQLKSGYSYLIDNRRSLNLRSVYWFSWRDMPKSMVTCNFCYQSGLFKAGSGFKAKPAWNAFRAFSR